jgi:polyisoprenoid-binding protein YceI
MKKIVGAIVISFAVFSLAFTGEGDWKVDLPASKVKFSLPGGGGDSGYFSAMDAKIKFDSASFEKSIFTASVDVGSLASGDAGKNAHLLSEDFFDAAKFPKMTFNSTKVSLAKEGFLLEGKLTIKKITKKVSIPFKFSKKEQGGIFQGTFEIFAGDFGVMKKSKSGADKVKIALEIAVLKN